MNELSNLGMFFFLSHFTPRTLLDLYLGRNNFDKTIPSGLGQITDLRWEEKEAYEQVLFLLYFLLCGTYITFYFPLRFFWGGENKLTGPLPPSFGSFTGLQGLELRANSITGPFGDEFLQNWPDAIFFDVAGNKFKGSLSTYIGSMSRLSLLDFSQNEFSGPIPTGNYLQNSKLAQLSQKLLTCVNFCLISFLSQK